jgi:hypothetical protein|nr:carboxypeptidase-like regulatory domain-containing protein [uncultured Psychroserpens sp.]
MRTSLNINIPEPCHEDWSKMTPQQKGRHCTSCEKTVYDFTTSTDEQIVKTILNEAKICGRFKSTQLNRELVLNRKERHNYLTYVASTLFAFLSFGTQDVEAQGKPRIVNVDATNTQLINGKIGTSILNSKTIEGTILSKTDGLPLPGVRILNLRTNAQTQSDFDGNYSLKVKAKDSLSYKFNGMQLKIEIIENFDYHKVEMLENPCAFDAYVVAGTANYNFGASLKKECKEYKRKLKHKTKREKFNNGELKRTTVGSFLYNITNIFRRKE